MMHLHRWGEWSEEGTIYAWVGTGGILGNEEDMKPVGVYYEIGCERSGCDKVKARLEYDNIS